MFNSHTTATCPECASEKSFESDQYLTKIWAVTKWDVFETQYKMYRVGQKIGPVWALITLQRLPIERCVICQKFQNVVEKKGRTCIAQHLSILCLICINFYYPWN